MIKQAHKIGAVFYALWGLLHIVGGAAILGTVFGEGLPATLAAFGTALPAESLATAAIGEAPGKVVASVTAFHAFNLLWMGLVVFVVAVRGNWRGDPAAYWINLAVAGLADLGLVLFLIAPGTMRLADGLPGLVLFLPAFVFTTIAFLNRRDDSFHTGAAQPA